MHLLRSERGYIEYIFLLILLLPAIWLLFFKHNITPPGTGNEACAALDTTTSVKYNFADQVNNGSPVDAKLKSKVNSEPYNQITGTNTLTFYRIKQNVAIPTEVTRLHMAQAGTVTDKNNKPKTVYILLSKCDGEASGATTNSACADQDKVVWSANMKHDPANPNEAYNLIYVLNDRNPTPLNPTDPYRWFDVYSKNSTNLAFIKSFCDQFADQNYTSPLLLGDSKQPPQKINIDAGNPNLTEYPTSAVLVADDTLSAKRRTDGIGGDYQLVGYAPLGSLLTDTQNLKGDLSTSPSIKGTYQVDNVNYLLGYVSQARFIILINSDDRTLVYYYRPAQPGQPAPPAPAPLANLQLRSVNPGAIPPFAWWMPECKPAIYLYPQTPTQVSVKVSPKGYLTYTKPLYPENGWSVLAKPNGQLQSGGNSYDYLYYESKIRDDAIDKPTHGFVVETSQLANLYSTLLPKLGLNQRETADFIEYWKGILPKAPYYFVGVMPTPSINKIEPLTITPNPQTTIRVRLYFQPLDQKISVPEPLINTPQREGFTAVEWGGLVKTDHNHPFTCSQ